MAHAGLELGCKINGKPMVNGKTGSRSFYGDVTQRLTELKGLEWVFVIIRWLYVPIIFVFAIYNHLPATAVWLIPGSLAVANLIVFYLDTRIRNPRGQTILGVLMLGIDAVAIWSLILFFLHDPNTSVYLAFTLVIIEGAIRFNLKGGLMMGGIFAITLLIAWAYRL